MFAKRAAYFEVLAGLRLVVLAALLTSLSCTRGASDRSRETSPPRERNSELRNAASPESPPTSVVSPRSSNSDPPSIQCEERSFEFRKIVGGCFVDQDLCGEVLSVAFDQYGAASTATFLGELPTATEQSAQRTLDCVRGRFAQLGSPCSKRATLQFKQSCTLR
jgi:hypothetical protein